MSAIPECRVTLTVMPGQTVHLTRSIGPWPRPPRRKWSQIGPTTRGGKAKRSRLLALPTHIMARRVTSLHAHKHADAAEIFTRPAAPKSVNDLRVLGEQTFVLDVAGITATSPPTIDRLSFLTRKIHPAIEHPNNLLVGMLVRSGMYTRLHFPPHDHALFKDTPSLNFIGECAPTAVRARARRSQTLQALYSSVFFRCPIDRTTFSAGRTLSGRPA